MSYIFSNKTLVFALLAFGLLAFGQLGSRSSALETPSQEVSDRLDSMTVWDIFEKLGKIKLHRINTKLEAVSVQRGYELVHEGQTTSPDGKRTKRQSKHFVCTSCHNTVRETDNLKSIKPEDRLAYSREHKVPFLQGSPFFGIVNRVTFYNNDYQKKYSDIPDIKRANRDIRQAIQICATECARGRALEDWEIESILAYFWTLQLKVTDLKLTETSRKKIIYALDEARSTARAIHLLEAQYADRYPATFVEAMPYRTLQYPPEEKQERIANGKAIYELGCKYCHEGKRYSFYSLDDSKKTFRQLHRKLESGDPHSIYKITRTGTYSSAGKKAYMPQYTQEKMSDRQIEDLRIFVESQLE